MACPLSSRTSLRSSYNGATTFSGLGLVKAVGDNVALVDLLKERTLGIRTTDALHFFA